MNPKLLSPYVGCAGWSIPKENTGSFPEAGTHLQRYAQRFRGVEINSSFYRPHKPQTYAKWAGDVRDDFRFAVKVPKVITHEGRLKNAGEPLTRFLQEVGELGPKLGPLLVQLPPSLAFDEAIVSSFFSTLRDCFAGHVVCEPRHLTWFSPEANELLAS
ncbi:MAG TPA: DUF72 domain-containing protein, partial [Abditibacteriaceae bacterium]